MNNPYLDMLALLGEGSAHPGGFSATVKLLEKLKITQQTKLLDVGCGTGRTACYAASRYKCDVTGIDSRPLMIEKANNRARSSGVHGQFICADALRMPFQNRYFDTVLAESVTIFMPIKRVVQELYRVTKPGGRVINLELCKYRRIPQKTLVSLFGIKRVPSIKEWLHYYKAAGFRKVRVFQRRKSFSPQNMLENEINYPDHQRMESIGARNTKQVSDKMKQVALFLNEYAQSLGYIVISAKK